MNTPYMAPMSPIQSLSSSAGNEASAVSWPAIVAGAAGAAALSLILLILGTGLGLSSISPWSGQGVSAASFGVSTVLWVTLTQIAAAGMGGYLAGRLRTRWHHTHADEVYFRDTAHGFLSWALATLLTAALLTSAIGNVLGSGARLGATATTSSIPLAEASGALALNGAVNSNGYFVDALFRPSPGTASTALAPDPSVATEVSRILVHTPSRGLSADDSKYVGQLVAQRTGLSQSDAERRVSDVFARVQATAKNAEVTAKDAADKARKASAYAALWLFISLLAGAFFASLAATFGGSRRDRS